MFSHDKQKTTIQAHTEFGFENNKKYAENTLFSRIFTIHASHYLIISSDKNKTG